WRKEVIVGVFQAAVLTCGRLREICAEELISGCARRVARDRDETVAGVARRQVWVIKFLAKTGELIIRLKWRRQVRIADACIYCQIVAQLPVVSGIQLVIAPPDVNNQVGGLLGKSKLGSGSEHVREVVAGRSRGVPIGGRELGIFGGTGST